MLTVVVGLGAVAIAAASSLLEPAICGTAGRLETRLDELFVGSGWGALVIAPVVAVRGRARRSQQTSASTAERA